MFGFPFFLGRVLKEAKRFEFICWLYTWVGNFPLDVDGILLWRCGGMEGGWWWWCFFWTVLFIGVLFGVEGDSVWPCYNNKKDEPLWCFCSWDKKITRKTELGKKISDGFRFCFKIWSDGDSFWLLFSVCCAGWRSGNDCDGALSVGSVFRGNRGRLRSLSRMTIVADFALDPGHFSLPMTWDRVHWLDLTAATPRESRDLLRFLAWGMAVLLMAGPSRSWRVAVVEFWWFPLWPRLGGWLDWSFLSTFRPLFVRLPGLSSSDPLYVDLPRWLEPRLVGAEEAAVALESLLALQSSQINQSTESNTKEVTYIPPNQSINQSIHAVIQSLNGSLDESINQSINPSISYSNQKTDENSGTNWWTNSLSVNHIFHVQFSRWKNVFTQFHVPFNVFLGSEDWIGTAGDVGLPGTSNGLLSTSCSIFCSRDRWENGFDDALGNFRE